MQPAIKLRALRVLIDFSLLLLVAVAGFMIWSSTVGGGTTWVVARVIPVHSPEGVLVSADDSRPRFTGAAIVSSPVREISGKVAVPESGRRTVRLLMGVSMLLVLAFLMQLRGLVTQAMVGRPFCTANSRRLRLMGWMACAAGVGLPLVHRLNFKALKDAQLPGFRVVDELQLSLTPFGYAIALFALAEIFAHGSRLGAERVQGA